MPHLPNREWSRQSVWLPWVHRLASAWLRGEPVAVDPDDQPAVEAAARPPRPDRRPARQGTFAFVADAVPCPHPTRRLKWHLMDTGGAHLGAFCRRCGKWLRWVTQDPKTLAAAPPRPERRDA